MKTIPPAMMTATLARVRGRSWPRLFARLRLLPLLIFIGSLFLTVKVGLIWRESGTLLAGSAIVISGAEAKSAAAPAQPEPAADKPTAGVKHAAAKAGSGGDATPITHPDGAANAGRRASAKAEEPAFSPAELEVLRQLADRRASLDARARELDKRDALLSAAERRLDAKAEALKALQAKVTALLKTHDSEEDAKMASLAKLYESMKPKDAAAILQTLEMDTLLRVAQRMKERKLAPIMAKMNPARARDVTMELVRLRAIDPAATIAPPTPRPGRAR